MADVQAQSTSTPHGHGDTQQAELRAFDAHPQTGSAADLHRFDSKRPAEACTRVLAQMLLRTVDTACNSKCRSSHNEASRIAKLMLPSRAYRVFVPAIGDTALPCVQLEEPPVDPEEYEAYRADYHRLRAMGDIRRAVD